MSDRIKKIKIKQADGTYSDYIPIGADAKNIDTTRGENLQTTINKQCRYYSSLTALKLDDYLQENDLCQVITEDGENIVYKISTTSASGIELENGLYARAIMSNFNVFPSDNIIASLPNNSYFSTKGFYSIGDGGGTTYFISTTWKPSTIKKGIYYISPIYQGEGELFMPYFGIREGALYAENNSDIFESINYIQQGALLIFPSGHFYFDRTLVLSRQNSIKGAGADFSKDFNTRGLTWLHFPNLGENEAAIKTQTGSLNDFILVGNSETYSLTIDRTKTVVAPDEIVDETSAYITYGIKHENMGTLNIQNVGFINFYYGAWIHTANITISHIYVRQCHYGISIGNDTRIDQLYAWNVMVALQMRGSISSASQIRGDSIGKHLVELATLNDSGGTISGVYLDDLDADYCLGSIVHLGSDGAWESITGLYINGIRGRACTYLAYDSTVQDNYNIDNISESLIEYAGIISVSQKTHWHGGLVVLQQSVTNGANPLDTSSSYKCPTGILGIKATSEVANVIFQLINGTYTDNINITQDFITKRIKSYSINTNNIDISIRNHREEVYYCKNGKDKTYKKLTPQEEVAES